MKNYERPEVAKLQRQIIVQYRDTATLYRGLLHLWLSFVPFLFVNINLFRSGIEQILPSFLFQITIWIGTIFYVVFFVSSIYAFYLYFIPPPVLNLDEKQMKLLGLDSTKLKAKSTSPLSWKEGTSTPPTPPTPPVDITSSPSDYSSPYQYYKPTFSPTTPVTPTNVSTTGNANDSYYSSSSSYSGTPTRTPTGTILTSPYRTMGSPDDSARKVSISALLSTTKLSPTKEYSFSDEKDLNRFLIQQEKTHKTPTGLSPSSVTSPYQGDRFITSPSISGGQSMGNPLILPKYSTMKPTDLDLKKTAKNADSMADNEAAAMKLYNKLKVTPYIDNWAERTRLWIASRCVKPVVSWMKMIEQTIGKEALIQPQITQVQSGVHMMQNQQAALFTVKPILPSQILSTPQQQQLLEERMKVERYFGDFGAAREYVVERIKVLAEGQCLAAYRWEGGGEFKGKKWSKELPADAQILAHLFCCYMDDRLLPSSPSHQNDTFSSKHFAKTREKIKATIAILQHSVHPPHYNVVADNELWVVLKGRNNLFHAISLFVLYVQRSWNGFFHQIYLGGPKIDLLDTISDDDDDDE